MEDLDPIREVADAVDGHLTLHYTANAPEPMTAWRVQLIWAARDDIAAGSFYGAGASPVSAIRGLLDQMEASYPADATHEPPQEET